MRAAKHGFNDDKILNSRYVRYLDDDWDQSMLMSFTRPRAAEAERPRVPQIGGGEEGARLGAGKALLDRVAAWKESRMMEYGTQLVLVEQLVNEVAVLQDSLGVVEGRLCAPQPVVPTSYSACLLSCACVACVGRSHLNRDYAALRRANLVLEQQAAEYRSQLPSTTPSSVRAPTINLLSSQHLLSRIKFAQPRILGCPAGAARGVVRVVEQRHAVGNARPALRRV